MASGEFPLYPKSNAGAKLVKAMDLIDEVRDELRESILEYPGQYDKAYYDGMYMLELAQEMVNYCLAKRQTTVREESPC